jgi:hypothetical protein
MSGSAQPPADPMAATPEEVANQAANPGSLVDPIVSAVKTGAAAIPILPAVDALKTVANPVINNSIPVIDAVVDEAQSVGGAAPGAAVDLIKRSAMGAKGLGTQIATGQIDPKDLSPTALLGGLGKRIGEGIVDTVTGLEVGDAGQLAGYAVDYPRALKDAVGAAASDPGSDTLATLALTIIDPGLEALKGAGVPLQDVKNNVGSGAYTIATGGEVDGELDPILLWVRQNPEQHAAIKAAYEQGYNGFTGEAAVWEYLVSEQGFAGGGFTGWLLRTGSDLIYDPLTYTPVAGKVGASLKESENVAARLAGRAVSAIDLPNAIVDNIAHPILSNTGKAISKTAQTIPSIPVLGPVIKKVGQPAVSVADWLRREESGSLARNERQTVGANVDTLVKGVDEVSYDIDLQTAQYIDEVREANYMASRQKAENTVRAGGKIVPGDTEPAFTGQPRKDAVLRPYGALDDAQIDAAITRATDNPTALENQQFDLAELQAEQAGRADKSRSRVQSRIGSQQVENARSNVQQTIRDASKPKQEYWSVQPGARMFEPVDWAAREVPEVWSAITEAPTFKALVARIEPRLSRSSGKWVSRVDERIARGEIGAVIKNEMVARGVKGAPPLNLSSDALRSDSDDAVLTWLEKYMAGQDVPDAQIARMKKNTEIKDRFGLIERIRTRNTSDAVTTKRVDDYRSEKGLDPVYSASEQAAVKASIPIRADQMGDHIYDWHKATVDQIDTLPLDQQRAIGETVGPWSAERYANYDSMTPFDQLTTDLEYAGRVRASVIASGGDVAPPPSVEANNFDPGNFTNEEGAPDLTQMFEAVVLEPDFEMTTGLRKFMYQGDSYGGAYLRPNPPNIMGEGNIGRGALDPIRDASKIAVQQEAFKRYLKMYELRHMIHGDAEDVLKGVSWMPGMEAVPGSGSLDAYKPVRGTRPDKVTEAAYFVENAVGERVRRETGELWWATLLRDAKKYADDLKTGAEVEPVLYRKATPSVDPVAPVATEDSVERAWSALNDDPMSQTAFDEYSAKQRATAPSNVTSAPKTTNPRRQGKQSTNRRVKTEKPPLFATREELDRLTRAHFDRAMKEAGDMSATADTYLEEMRLRGILDDEMTAVARTELTIPAKEAKGKLPAVPEETTTVFAVIMKQMNAPWNWDEAAMTLDLDKVRRSAQAEIARYQGADLKETRNLFNLIWDGMDTANQLPKEILMNNAFTGGILGVRDGIGNLYSMAVLNGKLGTGVRAATDKDSIMAFIKHNLDGGELNLPGMETVDGWGGKPSPNVIGVQVKEIGGDISDETLIARIVGGDRGGSKKLQQFTSFGSKGRAITRPFVSKRIRAFRHAMDQVNRFHAWLDVFDNTMKRNSVEFLESIRANYDNPEQWLDQLGDGPFSRKDVWEITGDTDLANDWAARVKAANKAGDAEVDKVYFSYKQTNADAILRRTLIFHYWMSRHTLFHTRAVLNNPMLLYRYSQGWEYMDKWAEDSGTSNPLKFFIRYQHEGGWLQSIVSPLNLLVPYTMFSDFGGEKRDNEKGFDEFTRVFPGFIAPWVQAAALVTGKSDRYPDVTGMAGVTANAIRVINWAQNSGIPIPGMEEGVTPNYMKSINDKVLSLVNQVIAATTDAEEIPIPDQVEQNKQVVKDILLDQVLAEYKVDSYYDLPAPIRTEVDAAMLAIETGVSGNERAVAAYRVWGDLNLGQELNRVANPLQTQVQSTGRQERIANSGAGYDALDTGVEPTPVQQGAMDNSDYLSASPESRDLTTQEHDYRSIGDETTKSWVDQRDIILYGKVGEDGIESFYVMEVGGETYAFAEVTAMTDEQRRYLADKWLEEQGPAVVKLVTDYDNERSAIKDGDSAYGDYATWAKEARADDDGHAFRLFATEHNPNFARALEVKKQRLIGDGLSGPELEAELDQWALSTDGYLAFTGTENKVSDPDPIAVNDPSNDAQMPPNDAEMTQNAAGTSQNTAWNTERDMPQWQVDDEKAILQYYAQLQAALDKIGVTDLNMLNPIAQDYVKKDLPERPYSVAKYEKWAQEQPEGSDLSLAAYWAALNAEYDATKAAEIEASLGT